MASILVTGASTGIGEACALHFDLAGHRVFAGVRTDADAERLAMVGTSRLEPLLLDVCDAEQIAAASARLDAELGSAGLDGLVNNAGIAVGGPVEFLPLEDWRRQLEVNVVGQVAVTRALMPALRRARGRVVFIGSISGRVSTPMMGPYSASKHAIEAIGWSLEEELRGSGMHASVVEPGAIATAIWGKGRATADALEASMPEEALRRYGSEFERIRGQIDAQEAAGIEPVAVAEVVGKALFDARPRRRYLVGRDAKAAALMARWLPDRALAAVVRRLGP